MLNDILNASWSEQLASLSTLHWLRRCYAVPTAPARRIPRNSGRKVLAVLARLALRLRHRTFFPQRKRRLALCWSKIENLNYLVVGRTIIRCGRDHFHSHAIA